MNIYVICCPFVSGFHMVTSLLCLEMCERSDYRCVIFCKEQDAEYLRKYPYDFKGKIEVNVDNSNVATLYDAMVNKLKCIDKCINDYGKAIYIDHVSTIQINKLEIPEDFNKVGLIRKSYIDDNDLENYRYPAEIMFMNDTRCSKHMLEKLEKYKDYEMKLRNDMVGEEKKVISNKLIKKSFAIWDELIEGVIQEFEIKTFLPHYTDIRTSDMFHSA